MAALVALAATLALAVPPAGADSGSPVVRPKPGATVETHPLRIVVRSGPELGDLRATLNRNQVGEEFSREPGGRRVLDASNSHSLRHGKNVLRVKVRTKDYGVRRQTVRFRVTHRRPLVGAGADQRVGAGAAFELPGELDHHPRGPRIDDLRWRIKSAPRQSRQAAAAISDPQSLTPTFEPDAPGTYRLGLTGTASGAEVSDLLTVHALPENLMVPLDTDPEGSSGEIGIRVGPDVYAAPPMNRNGGYYEGSDPNVGTYRALWQVLVLDRRTLAPVANRTYGSCAPANTPFICRIDSAGSPRFVADAGGGAGETSAMATELLGFGPDRLIIAVNHRVSTWGPLEIDATTPGLIVDEVLTKIGFPQSEQNFNGKSAAVIGVPGMKADEADYVITEGAEQMRGFLTPDTQKNFGFVPGTRVPFDTRQESGCGSVDPNDCGVIHAVGGTTVEGKLQNGEGGYFVSAWDQQTLAPVASQMFATAGSDAGHAEAAAAMAAFLKQQNDRRSVIFVSSFETPGQQPTPTTINSAISQSTWRGITAEIVRAGGTAHRFNFSASNTNRDYTLVGWSGAYEGATIGSPLEGDAVESIGPQARLRGALVPDRRSQYRPMNVTSGLAAPAERLNRLLVQEPSSDWPLDDASEGARQALADIGLRARMTSNPRVAYIRSIHQASDVAIFRNRVEAVQRPANATYSQEDFDLARTTLITELDQVEAVRAYLEKLAAPVVASNDETWEEVADVADRLQADLDVARSNAESALDYWSLAASLLDILGAFAGDPFLGDTIFALSGSIETADTFWSGDYDGSSAVEDDPRVSADELAKALQAQATTRAKSFERMGDVIVSDPKKLAEVGEYAECTVPCLPGQPEFDEYSTDDIETAYAVALRGLDQAVYSHLVPMSFPIWDAGLTRTPDPIANYSCPEGASPFFTGPNALNLTPAPEKAYTRSIDDLDPGGNATETRVMVMVHKEGDSVSGISWPDDEILDRMFGEITSLEDADEGGLGIVPQDLMREKWREGEPTRFVQSYWDKKCYWTTP